jgi:hypothetical protein
VETPEFLAWALQLTCPLRGEQDGSDPERTERQLRAARAASDARRENRVFEGLAVDPPHGFRLNEALAIYGGESAVAAACRACPANCVSSPTLRVGHASELMYAGCYGLTPVGQHVSIAVEQAIEHMGLASEVVNSFPPSTPRWYALWINSPLSMQQLAVVGPLIAAVGLSDLAAGCATALSANLPLHVRLYPAGKVEGTWWRLVAHCPRCKGAWPGERSRQCRVCGYVGHPAPDKKRRVRGRRPYARLDHVLGAGESTEFLARYFDFQMQQQPPDRA